jgi:hypothetical protein
MALLCFDSITRVPPTARGKAVLAASHGGLHVANAALRLGLSGLIVNDAGVGRERAGVAALDALETHGVAAATVSAHSARIGDGADCLSRGVISFANEPARRIGIARGMTANTALGLLSNNPRQPKDPVPNLASGRREVRPLTGAHVVIVDSNSMVEPADDGALVVTGSHGALPGGRSETAVSGPVTAAIYNDADGGIDGAGFSRLAALDARGIAAATVSAWSALIGDGRSTFEDGYVTHVNTCATVAGGEIGISCHTLLTRLIEWRSTRPVAGRSI